MDKKRKEIIEKLTQEMFHAFRSMRPDHDQEHKGFAHKIGQGFGHFGKHKFGRGHMDLFFRLMKEKEGISVKDIADSLKITSGAVTQMVDKAVEMGIVTREEDAKDRRSQRIKLSETAKDRVEAFRSNFVERLEPKFANLSDKEVSQLTSLLSKINISAQAEDSKKN